MRILQCPVPAARLESGMGATVAETLGHFATVAIAYDPLIDDGAGDGLFRGKATANPPIVSKLTADKGLLLVAKDMDTLRRGCEKYPNNVSISAENSGIGMVVGKFDRGGSKMTVGNFVQWGVNNAKQHFLHDSFSIAAWLLKHSLSFPKYKGAERKLQEMFVDFGGEQIITFGDFRRHFSQDNRIMAKHSFVFLLPTAAIAPGLEMPGGGVGRYISQTVSIRDIPNQAARLLKGTRESVSGGIFS